MWLLVVIIPREGVDHQYIGMVEVIWKLITSTINQRFAAVELHDELYKFK